MVVLPYFSVWSMPTIIMPSNLANTEIKESKELLKWKLENRVLSKKSKMVVCWNPPGMISQSPASKDPSKYIWVSILLLTPQHQMNMDLKITNWNWSWKHVTEVLPWEPSVLEPMMLIIKLTLLMFKLPLSTVLPPDPQYVVQEQMEKERTLEMVPLPKAPQCSLPKLVVDLQMLIKIHSLWLGQLSNHQEVNTDQPNGDIQKMSIMKTKPS